MRMRTQRGSTLLVVMIFLLVFGMMTAAAFRGSLTSVQAIGNMQWRNEAITAANDAIDRLLSSADFATKTAVVTKNVNDVPLTLDVNGDGVTDISVNFPAVPRDSGPARPGPRCMRAEPIPTKDLDPTLDADKGCFGSSASSSSGLGVAVGTGVGTVVQSPSLCSNTEWSITVRAVDAVTNTTVDVVQGVGVRVPTTSVPVCN
jgi:type II secretory pathway pseudopilin PulG